MPETETQERSQPTTLSRIVLWTWLAYWAFLFMVMHLPRPPGLKLVERLGDKVVHAAAYFVLAAAGGLAARLRGHRTDRRWLRRWATVYIVYAAFDEFLQCFIEGRSGQVTDWIADLIGALLGLSFVYALSAIEQRRMPTDRTA